jgi:thiamine biosynthesis lipoprotein
MRPQHPSGAAFAVGGDAAGRGILRFSHEAMASVFEVHCVHADAGYAGQAAQEAFALLDRLEQEQSRFIANSDVSRVNALSAGASTRVTPRTLECLGIARHLYELTGRTFDVSIGSGWEKLELLPEAFSVRALAAGASLDLGGIGKGYAVDRMAELLLEWDVPSALVHGGFSSVRALEAPPGLDGWPLRLSAPGQGTTLARISARQQALGASGTLKGDHIRDPRTGQPAPERAAAWVAVAAEAAVEEGQSPAAVADALSTAFMILTVEEVGALCSRFPELQAWLVPARGQTPPAVLHLPASR